LQIRRMAAELPLDAIVLETDAPDISPSWVHPGRNSPDQIPRIGAVLAELRGLTPEQIAAATTANAHAAIPRLTGLVR
jgi:TatD DNase family protein